MLTTLKNTISGLTLVPGRGGCFEVSRDGDLLYSKLATGEFPDEDEILGQIRG